MYANGCVFIHTHTHTCANNSLTFMLDQLLMSQDISSCQGKVKDLVLSFQTFLPLFLLQLFLCPPPNWPLSVNFA